MTDSIHRPGSGNKIRDCETSFCGETSLARVTEHADRTWMGTVELMDKKPDIFMGIPPPADTTDDLILRARGLTASEHGETTVTNESRDGQIGTNTMVDISTLIPLLANNSDPSRPGNISIGVADTETVDKRPNISTSILTDNLTDDQVHQSDQPGITQTNVGQMEILDIVEKKPDISTLRSLLTQMSNGTQPDGLSEQWQSNLPSDVSTSSLPLPELSAMRNEYRTGVKINRKPVVVLERLVLTGSSYTGYSYTSSRRRLEDAGQQFAPLREAAEIIQLGRNKTEGAPPTSSSGRRHLSRAAKRRIKPLYSEDRCPSPSSDDFDDEVDDVEDSDWMEDDDKTKPKNEVGLSRARKRCSDCGKPLLRNGLGRCECQSDSSDSDDNSCPECGKMFTLRSSLTRHIRNFHKGLRLFSCRVCNETFERVDALNGHMATHSFERPYKCATCGKAFKTEEDLDNHRSTHSMDTQPGDKSCPTRSKMFSWKSSLNCHIQDIHIGLRPYSCTLCDKTFKRKDDLESHRATHSVDRPCKSTTSGKARRRRRCRKQWFYGCATCGAKSRHVLMLREHIRANDGHKPEHQCSMCERFFGRDASLQKHMDMHVNGQPFKCNQCDFSTEYAQCLKTHVANHTAVHNKPCPQCGKLFTAERYVRRHVERVHMKIHVLPTNMYLCTVCGKTLSSKFCLNSHMATIHSDEKPHSCAECGKRFGTRAQLAKHVRAHGSMDLQCAICGTRFFYKERLEQHMVCHSDDTPFKCEHCGKKFKRQHNLDSHMRTHIGQRIFNCDICGQAFKWAHILRNHIKTHNPNRDFQDIKISPHTAGFISAQDKMN